MSLNTSAYDTYLCREKRNIEMNGNNDRAANIPILHNERPKDTPK